MGCFGSKRKEEPPPTPIGSTDAPPKTVDSRLPFQNYRQLFQMKNSWKAISRDMEKTSKDTFVRFFTAHPEYKALHKSVADLDGEEAMLASTAFEEMAAQLFATMDETMEAIEKDKVDIAIETLRMAGQEYRNLDGFTPQYFKDLEPHFMKAVEATLDSRYNTAAEQNFARFYEFCVDQLTADTSAVAENRV